MSYLAVIRVRPPGDPEQGRDGDWEDRSENLGLLLDRFFREMRVLGWNQRSTCSGEVWEEDGAVIVRCQISIDGGVP